MMEKKAEKDDRLSSSLPWIPGKTRLKNNSKVTCRNQNRYITKLIGNALKTPCIGSLWQEHRKKALTFWQKKKNRMLTRQYSQIVSRE